MCTPRTDLESPSFTPRTDLLEPPSFTDVDSSSEANYAPSTISSILSRSVSVSIPSLPFPDSPIQDPEGSGLFKTLAARVTKWRMLARYLGLPDDAIAAISQANLFDNERCYKMMLSWSEKSTELATYLKLADSLRNIMRDDLLMEVTRYLPEVEEEGGGELGEDGWEIFSVVIGPKGSSNLRPLKKRFNSHNKQDLKQIHVKFCYKSSVTPSGLASYPSSPPLLFSLSSVAGLRVIEDLCWAASAKGHQKADVSVLFVK